MERNKIIIAVMGLCLPLMMFASCGTKRQIISDPVSKQAAGMQMKQTDLSDNVKKLTFVQQVSDNQVYTKNITGSMDFTIDAGGKQISVGGSLHMRKDEVIRLQLFAPILGFEVGRLEFAPDYVLIVDRIHKEYVKADYNKVDFLQQQGINFYSLQALFWNQLLLPGAQKVSESDLKKFDALLNTSSDTVPVVLKNGDMTYTWGAQRSSGRIQQANVEYVSKQYGKSSVCFDYDDFRSVGVKYFPAKINLTLTTEATRSKKNVNVQIQMDEVKTEDGWDVKTQVSDKYKEVSAEDVLGKLINM